MKTKLFLVALCVSVSLQAQVFDSSTETTTAQTAKDKLASRIMTLHNDVQDMLYGCRCVYEEGKRRNLSLPIFYENIENVFSLNKGRNG